MINELTGNYLMLQNILESIALSLNPETEPGLRRKHLEYLESELKYPRFDLFEHAPFYALKSLESCILYKWNEQDKQIFISRFIEFLMAPHAPEIIRKSAQVLAEISKREWPGFFDLTQLLCKLYPCSVAQKQLCLMTLKNISDDTWNPEYSDEIVNTQRDLLVHALRSAIYSPAEYQQYINEQIKTTYKVHERGIYCVNTNSPGWYDVAVRDSLDPELTVSCLNLLSSLVIWIPPQKCLIFDLAQHFLQSKIPQIQTAASEIIYFVCSRNWCNQRDICAIFEPFLSSQILLISLKIVYEFRDSDSSKLLLQSITEASKQIFSKLNVNWRPELGNLMTAVLFMFDQNIQNAASVVCLWLQHKLFDDDNLVLACPEILNKCLNLLKESQVINLIRKFSKVHSIHVQSWILEKLMNSPQDQNLMKFIEIAALELMSFPSLLHEIYDYVIQLIDSSPNDQVYLSTIRAACACYRSVSSEQKLSVLVQKLFRQVSDVKTNFTRLGLLTKLARLAPDDFLLLWPQISSSYSSRELYYVMESLFVAALYSSSNFAFRLEKVHMVMHPLLNTLNTTLEELNEDKLVSNDSEIMLPFILLNSFYRAAKSADQEKLLLPFSRIISEKTLFLVSICHQSIHQHRWISSLRGILYTLLGSLASNCYFSADIVSAVYSHVFGHVFTVSLFTLSQILRLFAPKFYTFCPQEDKNVVFSYLPTLLQQLQSRIEQEWLHDNDSDCDMEIDLNEEIAKSGLIRVCSRDFMDFLAALTKQEIMEHIAQNQSIATSFLIATLSAFTFNDSPALRKSIATLKIIMGMFDVRSCSTLIMQSIVHVCRNSKLAEEHDKVHNLAETLIRKSLPDTQALVVLLNAGIPEMELVDLTKMESVQFSKKLKQLFVSISDVAISDKGNLPRSLAVTKLNKILIPKSSDDELDFNACELLFD